jgi:hypothetical protein
VIHSIADSGKAAPTGICRGCSTIGLPVAQRTKSACGHRLLASPASTWLVPRHGGGGDHASTATTLFGRTYGRPFGIAPDAAHTGLCRPGGESDAARGRVPCRHSLPAVPGARRALSWKPSLPKNLNGVGFKPIQPETMPSRSTSLEGPGMPGTPRSSSLMDSGPRRPNASVIGATVFSPRRLERPATA